MPNPTPQRPEKSQATLSSTIRYIFTGIKKNGWNLQHWDWSFLFEYTGATAFTCLSKTNFFFQKNLYPWSINLPWFSLFISMKMKIPLGRLPNTFLWRCIENELTTEESHRIQFLPCGPYGKLIGMLFKEIAIFGDFESFSWI